ncbi:MAG: hypothetical protein R8K21_08720, partial [Mariprofundales bacterium]
MMKYQKISKVCTKNSVLLFSALLFSITSMPLMAAGIKGADWDKDAKIPVYRGGIGKAILLDDNIVLNTQPEPKNLSQYQA